MAQRVDCIMVMWHQIRVWLANGIKKMDKTPRVSRFMSQHCISHTSTHTDSVM